MNDSIINLVRQCANKKILFLPHAIRQMSRPDRMINIAEVKKIINEGEIIQDYPKDPRGHSCLIFGYGDRKRPIHIVCSPKNDYLAIITAYLPNSYEWENNYKKRN